MVLKNPDVFLTENVNPHKINVHTDIIKGVFNMVKIKPLGNRVCIKRSKQSASKGGILLPDTAQEKPLEGDIIEVGNGKVGDDGHVEPMTLKKGDRVLFSSYAGTPVELPDDEDTEYLIMSEDEILGILT